MAARVGRVTFLRVLAEEEEAPRGECEEWRTCCWVRGWREKMGVWLLDGCVAVIVIAVAQVRSSGVVVVVVVFVDTAAAAAALARARDMFALMFAGAAVGGGWLG
jgi:hypothetical protein